MNFFYTLISMVILSNYLFSSSSKWFPMPTSDGSVVVLPLEKGLTRTEIEKLFIGRTYYLTDNGNLQTLFFGRDSILLISFINKYGQIEEKALVYNIVDNTLNIADTILSNIQIISKGIVFTRADGSTGGFYSTEQDAISIGHNDTIIFKNLNDPLGYGYDVFFSVEWNTLGQLAYTEESNIIMTDGENEQIVGRHTNGHGTRGLDCRVIGGYGDYSQLITDDRVSYNCQFGSSRPLILLLEKGKQYSFFVRYSKRGTESVGTYLIPIVTDESAISFVLEYADKLLTIK